LKLEPELDPKPEKLCEHGAWRLAPLNRVEFISSNNYIVYDPRELT